VTGELGAVRRAQGLPATVESLRADLVNLGVARGMLLLVHASPLARVYDLDGWVLLLGVGHEHNTSLHLAEYRTLCARRRRIETGAPIWVNGQRQWVTFEDVDYEDADFPEIGAGLELETGCVRSGRVAQAQALLMPQRALVDYAVGWMREHRQKPSAGSLPADCQ
jgi:aminoglycoside 3-N-acetyltransferase